MVACLLIRKFVGFGICQTLSDLPGYANGHQTHKCWGKTAQKDGEYIPAGQDALHTYMCYQQMRRK